MPSKKDTSDGANHSTATGGSVKKHKSFRRIRGLLKGESRKERRAKKAAAKAAARAAQGLPPRTTNHSNDDANTNADELSTVFGVDVEEGSVALGAASAAAAASFLQTPPSRNSHRTNNNNNARHTAHARNSSNNNTTTNTNTGKKAYILKVVLLLMDPDTRRFELLQLEFDSLKALVSDVLAQIPVSVTEEALRTQSYTGICGRDGVDMVPAKLLSSFCRGNEVLVAIPTGVAPTECARLARPILSDDKVVQMLASSGIDASGWKEDPLKRKKKKSALKSRSAADATPPTTTTKSSKSFGLIVIVLLALLLQVFHVYISAPIHPGNVVTPGIWLSQCGLLTIVPPFLSGAKACENAYVHFSRAGVVTHYNADKEITWQMEGRPCPTDDNDDKTAEPCINGLQLTNEGKVLIGSQPVSYLTSFVKDAKVSPWPFAEPPKLKVWRK